MLGNVQRRNMILLSGLLFGLVFWVFLPSLSGQFIQCDDNIYVTENVHLQLSPRTLVWALIHGLNANWHPVTQWSFIFDHSLYGFDPWGYHLTNVLLHAGNSVLLFVLLRRMTGATWRSLVVAGLFGLHPLRVESVAWISERKDVLSVWFWLWSLWAYVRYAQSVGSRQQSAFFYSLALLFCALGLMSKPMVVTLPGVVLLLDWWPLKRWPQKPWIALGLEKLPFVVLSALVSIITVIVQKNDGMMKELYGVSLSFGLRAENALVSYARYLGKLFWPTDLCAYYPHPGHWPPVEVLAAGLLLLGLSLLVFVLRRDHPFLLTGWLWFLGTLLPVIGLVQVGAQAMADRYSYFPSIGILIAVVWEGHRWMSGRVPLRVAGAIACGIMILGCTALTRHQLGFWRNETLLWSRAVAVTDNNFKGHNMLANALVAQGNLAAGLKEFRESIRLNPAFAEPWCSMGFLFNLQGNPDQAVSCYQQALAAQPDLVVAHMSLGNILLQAGRVDEAIAHFQQVIKLDPGLAAADDSLGWAFTQKGRLDAAMTSYRRAAELQPDSAASWNGLGLTCARTGRLNEALAAFQKAVALQPENDAARNNLGYTLLQLQRVDEAKQQFLAGLKLRPDNAETHNNLGSALLALGQLDEAIAEFQTALRLKPEYDAASRNLAFVLDKKRKSASSSTNSIPP